MGTFTGAGSNFNLLTSVGDASVVNSSLYSIDMNRNGSSNAKIDFGRGTGGADGYLSFSTAGSERLNIASNGDISFYEDTGTTAKLTWDASEEDLKFADDSKAIFGAGSDLQIYHDGTNSVIRDNGSGNLSLTTNGAKIGFYDQANGQFLAEAFTGAGFRLYYDGSQKFVTQPNGIDVTGTVTADGLTIEGIVSASGDIVSGGNISGVTKSFDIEHPTKDGMRLHHGVLEGPEHAVYIRGKSSSSVIELPDYWEGLVHEDTITVQLTPVGIYDKLYVEEIKDNKVTVYNNSEYFYFITGERKDIERFEVEYGDSYV